MHSIGTARRAGGPLFVPTIYASARLVEAGGLMSYWGRIPDAFVSLASTPADLKGGSQPTTGMRPPLRVHVNLKTAKTLGLDIPPTLLVRADEVIE